MAPQKIAQRDHNQGKRLVMTFKMDHAKREEQYPQRGIKRPLTGNCIVDQQDSPEGTQVTWTDSKTAVVTFLVPKSNSVHLCIVGRARLTCLKGSLVVFGYLLKANKSVVVTSPPWTSAISLTDVSEKTQLEVNSLRPNQNQPLPTFRLLDPTMVHPIVIPPSWKKAVDQITNELATARATETSMDESRSAVTASSLGGDDDDDDVVDKNETTINTQPRQERARIVLCGAKGVGKSTCLRYATNRLLEQYDQVAILDADVGQPEFSPPGLLTLSLTHRPLLQPPHMNNLKAAHDDDTNAHIITTVSSCFYGSLTSKTDPSYYVDCLQFLIQQYQQQLTPNGRECQLPLLINLDGWVKGMGYEVLTALLAKDNLHPSHVIQLVGETKAKVFDLTNVLGGDSDATLHVVDAFNNIVRGETTLTTAIDQHTDNIPPPPSSVSLSVVSSSIGSGTLRALRFASYFVPDPCLWDGMHDAIGQTGWADDECEIAHRLAAAKPYAVPFEAVEYFFVGADRQDIVQEDDILNAFNGGIVGLSRRCESNDQPNPTDGHLECFGLGLIRAIDMSRRLFYILTPVDPSKLSLVTCLCGGNLQPPLQFYFRGVYAESFPYLAWDNANNGGSNQLGAEPMTSRNNIVRRSTSNVPS
jgi:polynucleotide 5'-hydroxyl-kinase GRC3/NOL9